MSGVSLPASFQENLENSVVKTFPMGTLLYPVATLQDQEEYQTKKITTEEKVKIIQEVKEELQKIIKNFFSNNQIPIPKRFTIEMILDKWSEKLNDFFRDWEKYLHEEGALPWEEEQLIENIALVRRMERALEQKDSSTFKSLIDDYSTAVTQNFDLYHQSLEQLRTTFGLVFLNSELPPEFMTNTSKLVNTIISYLEFLQSLMQDIRAILSFVQRRGTVAHFKKRTKKFFVEIERLDEKQYPLILELFKLELFMDIWQAETVDDLFTEKEEYSLSKLDKEFFYQTLTNLHTLATSFHMNIIHAALKLEKAIPTTLSSGAKKQEEKLAIVARMLHS